MRLFIALVLLLFSFSLSVSAQTPAIDSLTRALSNHHAEDERKAQLLNALAYSYYSYDPQKTFSLADDVIKLNKQKKASAFELGKAYLFKAYAYITLSDFSSAYKEIDKAMPIARKLNDEKLNAEARCALGIAQMYNGKLLEALENFQLAASYMRKIDDKRELALNSNIAAIHSQMRNFGKALEYFEMTLEGAKKIKDTNLIGAVLLNMGAVMTDQGQYEKSILMFRSANSLLSTQNNRVQMARTYGNMGSAYNRLKEWDSAIYYTQKSIELNKQLQAHRSIAIQSCNLADIYNNLGKIPQAMLLLDTAYRIAKELNITDLLRIVLETKSDSYLKMGKADSALSYYKMSMAIKDSLLGDEAQKKLTKLELQYDFDRKADSLRFHNELTAIELQKQMLLSQQQKKDLLLVEKDRELQKLLSFQRLAALKAERLENDEKGRQLSIANKEKELQKVRIASLDTDNYLNKLRLRQQWFFSLGSILLLGGLGSFFIYRYNLKQSKLQAEIAKEKAEFETKMSNMALNSLRSQMNPHFIFNCLNSIRLFAAKNDSLSATNYISKFSRLMRLVLENSKSERISLKQEIETLQLYVDMELMRFKNKLKYDIHFQNGMDTEYIEVPPMLVQPYVENAIWHGLMHKEQGGKLEIDFSEEEETLIVKVKDNGIGRTKAAELKSKSGGHKSFAMNITQERLQLMNEKYGTDATIKINDLYHGEGESAGTEVIVTIPIL